MIYPHTPSIFRGIINIGTNLQYYKINDQFSQNYVLGKGQIFHITTLSILQGQRRSIDQLKSVLSSFVYQLRIYIRQDFIDFTAGETTWRQRRRHQLHRKKYVA